MIGRERERGGLGLMRFYLSIRLLFCQKRGEELGTEELIASERLYLYTVQSLTVPLLRIRR